MPGILALIFIGLGITAIVLGAIFLLPHADSDYGDIPVLPIDLAHEVMQLHDTCRLDDCVDKRAAFRTLFLAGHLEPDARVERFVR